MGDRGGDLRGAAAVRGLSAKPAMMAAGSSRPSRSKRAARTARGPHHGGVARVVVVADRQRDVVERGQRVAVFGLQAGKMDRQADSL